MRCPIFASVPSVGLRQRKIVRRLALPPHPSRGLIIHHGCARRQPVVPVRFSIRIPIAKRDQNSESAAIHQTAGYPLCHGRSQLRRRHQTPSSRPVVRAEHPNAAAQNLVFVQKNRPNKVVSRQSVRIQNRNVRHQQKMRHPSQNAWLGQKIVDIIHHSPPDRSAHSNGQAPEADAQWNRPRFRSRQCGSSHRRSRLDCVSEAVEAPGGAIKPSTRKLDVL